MSDQRNDRARKMIPYIAEPDSPRSGNILAGRRNRNCLPTLIIFIPGNFLVHKNTYASLHVYITLKPNRELYIFNQYLSSNFDIFNKYQQ